ncbi:MAG: DinB family protein [Anaerolineae bacterium]|nr:DinB family protein [Anaerolineae bacterium]MCO5190861.1 DinB family protein [Anaerolineae bacterium]MCO5194180.1 DinB family protein [Anaerolineae bacterium]MCO5197320.1 DinB family protein [Anaerolineae bacterium]
MNAEMFRQLYAYHFAVNRKVWLDCVMKLSDRQFREKVGYSVGSVRNQTVHMLNVDSRWFHALRGEQVPGLLNPVYFGTKAKVRSTWDQVEIEMHTYMEALTDSDLIRPIDNGMPVWQVLFHVLNHGTDHRAQLLAALNRLGMQTVSQDYWLFTVGRL